MYGPSSTKPFSPVYCPIVDEFAGSDHIVVKLKMEE